MSSPYDIDWENPDRMLKRIEAEPKAFQKGRRNDDTVNWFLAMLLCGPGRTLGSILSRLEEFRDRMSEDQKWALKYWETDVRDKIVTLFNYYGMLHTPQSIMHYWIPVGYSHLNEVSEDQLQLVKGE